MPTEIRLPKLGESVFEGTIERWLKKPGDAVQLYEPLAEVVTDKVTVEMPSPVAGVLTQILVEEGKTVPAGTPIALIEAKDAAAATARSATGTAAEPSAVPPKPAAGEAVGGRQDGGPRLSPLVRRLAEEHGLAPGEVARIPGTGAGGRITKDDVLRFVGERRAAPAAAVPPGAAEPAASGPAAPARAPGVPAGAPPAPTSPARPAGARGDRVMRLGAVRRTIADRMGRSKREIPHAYGVIEVDMTEVVRWREAHKQEWRALEGANLTYTALMIRAVVEALKAFPIVNSTWTDGGVLLRGAINIGVGVAVEDGLVVPVLKQADGKSLVGIARELEDLSGRARANKLTLDDVQGGTFTITNPGVFGSIWSMPIVVPGQAAILAVDAIVKRPVVRHDAIAIRDVMHLGLSFDHRIFDGATAVQFLNRIKDKMENFRAADSALSDF
ncbi:MAG: 2-oxo acid dehydrogenase subunit E2 [Armatimonadetes bacterium]|nr:2-oxo acid dehydrogenase subunit E2 [Armatimonadota bacterium]